jgi:flagellar operon protein
MEISSELLKVLKNNSPSVNNVKKNPSSNEGFEKELNKFALSENDQDVNFSQHAMKRVEERNITMDTAEFAKLKSAVQALKNKGGQDSLVVTNKAAYIIDVKNNKVVTVLGNQDIKNNIFTKIDSTLFV